MDAPIKIQINEGCTTFDTLINDKSVGDYSPEEYAAILKKIAEKLQEGILNGTVSLESVIRCFQYEDYGSNNNPCGSCGDTTIWTLWNI